MTTYTVYAPPTEASDLSACAEGLVFVKQGFSWPALFVPPLWLLYQRLWLELMLFLLIFILLVWALGGSDAGENLFSWIMLGLVVLFAFEANDLRGAGLERRGYELAGLATGPDRDSAELSFLRSWLPRQGSGSKRQAPRARAAPAAKQAGEAEEVIGLFPRP